MNTRVLRYRQSPIQDFIVTAGGFREFSLAHKSFRTITESNVAYCQKHTRISVTAGGSRDLFQQLKKEFLVTAGGSRDLVLAIHKNSQPSPEALAKSFSSLQEF